MTENGWFVSHLTDLFYHSGQLDVLIKSDTTQDSYVSSKINFYKLF